MNKSYIEWIDYYKNATKEDVIQDMMLDINSIKEKDKEIDRLNNIINEIEEMLSNPYNVDCVNQNNDFLQRIKELKEGKE